MFPWGKVALIAAFAFVAIYLYQSIKEDGANEVRREIEENNREVGQSADDDRLSFDRCPPGMWDFGNRRCRQGD